MFSITTNKRLVSGIFVFLVLCFAVTSPFIFDQSRSPVKTTIEYPWTESFDYTTGSLPEAQQETPFTIVLPSYLPEGIENDPVYSGQNKDNYENYIPVLISYTGSDGKTIEVREYYEPLNGIPEDAFYKRLQISGTTVIEDDYSDIGTTADGSIGYISSYHYNWIEDPVLFSVYSENVDKDEVLDVIRSMIE